MSIIKSIAKIRLQNVGLFLLISLAVFGLLYFLEGDNYQTLNTNNAIIQAFLGEEKNEATLRNKYEVFNNSLHESKNYRKAYGMLAASVKERYSEEKFIEALTKNKTPQANTQVLQSENNINNIVIIDNAGFIDHTLIRCYDKNCENKKVSRNYQKWIFINKHWYVTLESPECIRDEPYEKPPEFDRAYSLIIQRLGQDSDKNSADFANSLKSIKNCIDIQYADSDLEMKNAEGFFSFNYGDTLEHLSVTVSPRYSIKDDLITSVLLVHELTHVVDHVNDQISGNQTDCYELEARAFQNQNYFLTILNQEERESVTARGLFGKSLELNQILDVYFTIPKYSGNTYSERASNFVKSSEFYQDQCSNFSN